MQFLSVLSVDEIKGRLAPYLEKLDIEKAVVFGSFARGTATKRSDIDLIIIMQTDKRFFERFDDLNELGSLIDGHHLDILVYTPAELKAISGRRFIENALKDGIVVYGN